MASAVGLKEVPLTTDVKISLRARFCSPVKNRNRYSIDLILPEQVRMILPRQVRIRSVANSMLNIVNFFLISRQASIPMFSLLDNKGS